MMFKCRPASLVYRLGVLAATLTGLLTASLAHADGNVFTFQPVLTIDALQNTTGGLRAGGLTMANLDLMTDWKNDMGWEAWGYVLIDEHDGFSSHYSGDLQTVSNIDALSAARLFEAWVKYTSIDGRWDTTIGEINLNGIFDVQPVATPFLNSSAGIGPDYSQTGPSIFPISGLGAAGEYRVTYDTTLRLGLFDGTPGDPNHQTVFAPIHLRPNDGLNYVAEFEHRFDDGLIKLGHWGYTDPTPEWDSPRKGSRQGVYGQVVWRILDEVADASQGLQSWVRVGKTSDDTLRIGSYLGAGLNYTGYFAGRDADQMGIAIMQAHLGPLYAASVGARRTTETTVELTYKDFVNDHFTAQPDIQWIHNPGGTGKLKDALVVGMRYKFQ